MPGWGEDGPTLEIYSYPVSEDRPPPVANRIGIAHIAFAVQDVARARDTILACGGDATSEVITTRVGSESTVTWCYAKDLEGNIIELQSWKK
jgi:hypothetical protein